MILVNKERFLLLPCGIFYIRVDKDEDPATALITNGLQVKGPSFEGVVSGDCYEANLSFAPTPDDDGATDWPCIGNVYDEEKGVSESMDINLTFTRGGLIGEDDLRFIILEPADMAKVLEWIHHGAVNISKWLAEQGENFPAEMIATKETVEDNYFV